MVKLLLFRALLGSAGLAGCIALLAGEGRGAVPGGGVTAAAISLASR